MTHPVMTPACDEPVPETDGPTHRHHRAVTAAATVAHQLLDQAERDLGICPHTVLYPLPRRRRPRTRRAPAAAGTAR